MKWLLSSNKNTPMKRNNDSMMAANRLNYAATAVENYFEGATSVVIVG